MSWLPGQWPSGHSLHARAPRIHAKLGCGKTYVSELIGAATKVSSDQMSGTCVRLVCPCVSSLCLPPPRCGDGGGVCVYVSLLTLVLSLAALLYSVGGKGSVQYISHLHRLWHNKISLSFLQPVCNQGQTLACNLFAFSREGLRKSGQADTRRKLAASSLSVSW